MLNDYKGCWMDNAIFLSFYKMWIYVADFDRLSG